MKTTVYAILFFAVLLAFPACSNGPSFEINDNNSDSYRLRDELKVKRGDQIIRIAGCRDCHSPKEMTSAGLVETVGLSFSGYPAKRHVIPIGSVLIRQGWVMYNSDCTMAVGPWGVSFASNLTPDSTGIGSWKLENFRLAIKEGRFKGVAENRLLLPPMPWRNYANMTDFDVEAIFAFLNSMPPVHNNVPQPFSFDNVQPLDTAF
jgi:hypothetical protein